MKFELIGKVKPYVRMTQRSKWVDDQAKEYAASQMRLGLQLNQQMAAQAWDILPGQIPLRLIIAIEETGGFHNKDLSNQLKALEDCANGIVYPDDRWIDSISIQRRLGQENRVEFTVDVVGEADKDL